MPKLQWDQTGERLYETGTKNAALFPLSDLGVYETGIAWNGMVAVRQSPDGAEETPLYADDIKYLSMYSAENFKGTIEAFTYPDEFAVCDGSAEITPGVYISQQNRRAFGLAYITTVGNDTMGNDYGEKLHVIYNAKVSPSERSYETINDTPNAITFSWEFTTTPVSVNRPKTRPTAHMVFDSTKLPAEKWTLLLDKVYGGTATEATLPTPDELITLVSAA